MIRLQSLSYLTPCALNSLFKILTWSIEKALEIEDDDFKIEVLWSQERAVAIAVIALRMTWFVASSFVVEVFFKFYGNLIIG